MNTRMMFAFINEDCPLFSRALASLGGYPDPAEGGPKLSCISCSTCLKTILSIL